MHVFFNIQEWKAWSPMHIDDQPDVSIIPPMLRRRLSSLARMAISVIMPLTDQFGAMPLVYVSRHGDLSRTLGLLEDMAKGEPVSPTAFSLSVHNATSGLFSIHQGLTKNITAISCGSEDLVPALLESIGQSNGDEPNILCVFCDEPPPAIYIDQISQPEQPYAVAMVINRVNQSVENGWKLEALASHSEAKTAEASDNLAQALQLLSLLQGDQKSLSFSCNGTSWQLSRCSQ